MTDINPHAKVLTFVRKGSSTPIVIQIKNKKYFVKLKAGLSGKYGLVHEWMGNKLGRLIGLPLRDPFLIKLDKNLITKGIHEEVADLIKKSYGFNIGFEYYENAKDLVQEDFIEQSPSLDPGERKEIFLLDLLMLNIDRTIRNINLLKVDDRVISIDYDCSLLINDLMDKKDLFKNKDVLKALRENPLLTEISDKQLMTFLKKVDKININSMLKTIPDDFLNKLDRAGLINGLLDRKKQDWRLKEILASLKTIPLETEDERKKRIKKNKEKFEKLAGITLMNTSHHKH